MGNTRKKGRRKKRKNTGTAAIIIIGIALLAVLFLLTRTLLHGLGSDRESAGNVTAIPEKTLPPSLLDAACFGSENGYKTYQSDELKAKLGIDVSVYQGDIDWEAVAQSDVDFAILRAGYRGYEDGETGVDEYFTSNLEQASACGMDLGIYFFSQALTEEEARNEALEVLKLIQGYEIKYPIYFDWEPVSDGEARTASISSTELTRCARAFCYTIESAGYRAGIYFNLDLASHYYHLKDLSDYSFWLAEYQDIPSFPYAFDMWQYTNQGDVPGINTIVDMNLSFFPDE
ncbi:MAG: glycoside hydrolase family 25 protein [Oscillospiraceae bacterium]|nr:glycoside hydrolase family 25 protein [Oscillospiraceae bacterium]